MNFLSVNVRGVGVAGKPAWINQIIRENRVDFFGVQETQKVAVSRNHMGKFWGNNEFEWAVVDAIGRSGGLVSMWNPALFSVTHVTTNRNFILTVGNIKGVESLCCIVNVYAPNDLGLRRNLWNSLVDLKSNFDGLWIFLGDFNDVRSPDERFNSVFDPNSALAFNNFISRADLEEYSMGGGRRFTYMSEDGEKLSKLDRVLVNESFLNSWPDATLKALPRLHSDHCPLILITSAIHFGVAPFRFFNSWLGNNNLDEVVASVFSEGVGGAGPDKALSCILKRLKEKIKEWRSKANEAELLEFKRAVSMLSVLEEHAEARSLSMDEKLLRVESKRIISIWEQKKCKDLARKLKLNGFLRETIIRLIFMGLLIVEKHRIVLVVL
ncbi:uncharacterized protein LOC143586507 [Bidens hawaiensis]|uniref:uncharacterized protein LOC143586507 n=1 Tax=Bidens hawaiensis TaxID=980011 RepID=UPI00404A8763